MVVVMVVVFELEDVVEVVCFGIVCAIEAAVLGRSTSGKLGGMFPPRCLMTSRSCSSCLVTAMTRLRRLMDFILFGGRETGN